MEEKKYICISVGGSPTDIIEDSKEDLQLIIFKYARKKFQKHGLKKFSQINSTLFEVELGNGLVYELQTRTVNIFNNLD